MPTATKSRTASKRTPSKTSLPDAIALLKQDHKEVKELFKQYDKLVEADAGAEEKLLVAQQVCLLLTVHAQIEEELLYPAAREVLDEDEDLVDEAAVEHQSAKDLIAQIQGMSPDEELYDAKVKVLGEYIDHHVKEEEKEMFPKLRKTELDLKDLGASLQMRKEQLLTETAETTETAESS